MENIEKYLKEAHKLMSKSYQCGDWGTGRRDSYYNEATLERLSAIYLQNEAIIELLMSKQK